MINLLKIKKLVVFKSRVETRRYEYTYLILWVGKYAENKKIKKYNIFFY